LLRDNKAIAYALMRLALGINFFGHGFFRILSGVAAFAAHTADNMNKGPLPHAFTLAFGYCVPFVEVALGVLLIVGLATRYALIVGAVFMVALTFGTTSIQNWAAAGDQLVYSAVFFLLLWLVEANTISLDGLLTRQKRIIP
jgi:thiosulfate dehydrogenase [quinone] large subunit